MLSFYEFDNKKLGNTRIHYNKYGFYSRKKFDTCLSGSFNQEGLNTNALKFSLKILVAYSTNLKL